MICVHTMIESCCLYIYNISFQISRVMVTLGAKQSRQSISLSIVFFLNHTLLLTFRPSKLVLCLRFKETVLCPEQHKFEIKRSTYKHMLENNYNHDTWVIGRFMQNFSMGKIYSNKDQSA